MLYLFDIDGTLVRAGGAGRNAMNQSFHAVFGVSHAFAGVDFRGSVDSQIVLEVMNLHHVEPTPDAICRFRASYADFLADNLRPPLGPEQRICPGVLEILDALAPRGPLGLVTGNWQEGAHLKLSAFGLWDRFSAGAWGEDALDRTSLVRIAIERARRAGHAFDRVALVGDTPMDVAAARGAGVLAVAVCTGWSPRESLEAAGPDLLVSDLVQGHQALMDL